DVFSQDTTWPRASGAFFLSRCPRRELCEKRHRLGCFSSGLESSICPREPPAHCVGCVTFPQPQGAAFALHKTRPLLDVFSQDTTWPRASGAFFLPPCSRR